MCGKFLLSNSKLLLSKFKKMLSKLKMCTQKEIVCSDRIFLFRAQQFFWDREQQKISEQMFFPERFFSKVNFIF